MKNMMHPKLLELSPSNTMYHELVFVTGNRNIKTAHITNLNGSMKKYPELLCCADIIICKNPVTKVYEIIDGQHRYTTAKMLGINIWVKVVDYKFKKLIGFLNSNQRNWTLQDFAKWHAENGNRNYRKFLDLLESNPVTPGILIGICQGSSTRDVLNGGNRDFKDGKLVINKCNTQNIEDTLYKLRQIEYASCNPPLARKTVKRKEFSEAFLHMFSKEKAWYDHAEFLKKLSNSRHKFNILANRIDMIHEILKIMRK